MRTFIALLLATVVLIFCATNFSFTQPSFGNGVSTKQIFREHPTRAQQVPLLASSFAPTPTQVANEERVYVTNSDTNTVVVIDPITLSRLATIPVGAEPIGAAVSPDGSRLYVMNGASSNVSVINTAVNAVVATISLTGFPIAAGFATDGSRAYVTDGLGVAVVDVATNTVLSHITLGTNGSHIAITPDSKHAYVSGGNGNVFFVDLTTNALVKSIPIQGATDLRGVAVTPDGLHAYVVSVSQNSVFVINTGTNTVTGTVTVGFLPVGIAITPDGTTAYVAATYGPVSAIDLSTNTVVANIAVPNHPELVAISADGSRVYVTDQIAAVAVINTNTNTVLAEIPTGGSPGGVAVTPRISTPCSSQPSISSVRPNTGGNTGSVTITLSGCLFVDGMTVKLTAAGQPAIVASAITVLNSGTLTATFDLRGANPGLRDIVLTSGNLSGASLPAAFRIEAGGAPQIHVNIIGLDRIRFDRAQTYGLEIVNTGSVDSGPGIVSFSIPSNVAFQEMKTTDLSIAGSTSAPDFGIPEPISSDSGSGVRAFASTSAAASNQVLLFATPGVPGGGAQLAPVQLTLPFNVSISQFTVTAAWQPDLLTLTFDQYLDARKVPYIQFNSQCSQCYSQAVTQVNTITDAQTIYTVYQLAKLDEQTALGKAAIALAQIALEAKVTGSIMDRIASSSGLVKGSIEYQEFAAALNASVSLYSTTLSSFSPDTSARDTFAALISANTTLAAKVAVLKSFLKANLPLTAIIATPAFDLLLNAINIGVPLVSPASQFWDARDAAITSRARFFPAFDAYLGARRAYEFCLNQFNCSVTTQPPPPPSLPGTTSKTVNGVGSLDPNDKTGPSGLTSQRYVSGSAELGYLIGFENKSTATAPVQQLTIQDQLDVSRFDRATVALGPIIVRDQTLLPLPGSQTYDGQIDLRPNQNLIVKIRGSFDPPKGMLTWNMTALDPVTNLPPVDPSVGFLAPGEGGSVFLNVAPRTLLPTGTVLPNKASIIFDVNLPLDTPEWSNTVDNTRPTSGVIALPTQSYPSFVVRWTGSDVGSGIQDFTIVVSDNSAPFTPWLTNTAATQATFTGQPGHTYAFYSVARDLVGNVENTKAVAEASTRIVVDSTPPVITPYVSGTLGTNGWYRSNVTVFWSVTDPESGVASLNGCVGTTLTADTAGVTLTCSATNGVGLTNSASIAIKLDKTPPSITDSRTPPPNVNGWNNTNVNVSFAAVDAISGVGFVTPPVMVTSEGAGQVVTGSAMDLAGNIAVDKVIVNVDKTPPEAFNRFDPVHRDVVLFGRDSLSGVVPGPLSPISVRRLRNGDDDDDDNGGRHSRDGDDSQVEIRMYKVFDLAGNSLLLVEKVRKHEHQIRVSIQSLQYNDGPVLTLPPNQEVFEWELANDGSLKELIQRLEVGIGKDRQDLQTRFEAKKNLTIIERERPKPETRVIKPGLVLVDMATDKGRLVHEF